MSHKNYKRYFIILQQDQDGYSLSEDKQASGYAKLEVKSDKCKISCYAQNLKKEEEPFHIVLIADKKDMKRLIKLGEMNIDHQGRSEISYEYSCSDIAKSGISIDVVSGTALIKEKNDEFVSVMSGFISSKKPEDWLKYSFEKPLSEPQLKSEAAIIEEANISIATAEEESEVFDEYENSIQEIIKDREVLSSDDREEDTHVDAVEETEEPLPVSNEVEEQVVSEKSNIDIKGTFRAVMESFEEQKNICEDVTDCKWYRISINNIHDICASENNPYSKIYQPMVSCYPYLIKHGYFLLGYKYDSVGNIKCLIYGVPGKIAKGDQPYQGNTGFVTWVSINKGQTAKDELGYWLMYYDYKKDTAITPLN